MRFCPLILTVIFIVFTCVTPVRADFPLPSAHPVKQIESDIKTKQQREKELKAEKAAIQTSLKQKRKEMVGVASRIKKNEQNLINLEQRIEAKEQEQLAIEVRLDNDRGSISDLILALERMRRIPPEAMLTRPSAPLETAQSAMLLQNVLPRVHKRAESLKLDIEKLDSIIVDLKQDRETVIATSKKLESNRNQLTKLLSERESLFAKTSKDIEKENASIKRISLQAKNLRDLVRRIEKKQRDEDERRKRAAKAAKSKPASVVTNIPTRTPIPQSGKAQLPISGLIKVGYGKTDDIGAVSQGLKIDSRKNALVVAPMGGVVDYAGNFKGYGQLIILKHAKGYHSLIAGLGKIDTVVGRAVSAGEPIGKMGAADDNNAPTLYYELRYEGNPVNPSKKISGLR